ncbi:MAG: hypothetical protein V1875_05585 [Candidatus Altiarchaeota archaeon]
MKIIIILLLSMMLVLGCMEPSEDYPKPTTTVKQTQTTLSKPPAPTATTLAKPNLSEMFKESPNIAPPQMPPPDY